MIRSLKQKFVAVFMTLACLVLLAAFSMNYLSSAANMRQDSEKTIQTILDRPLGGGSKPGISGGGASLPHFTIEVLGAAYIASQPADNPYFSLTQGELEQVVATVMSREADFGELKELNLRYGRCDTISGFRIVCVDMSFENQVQESLLRNSILAGVAALAAFFVLSLLLANWITRPVERAWQQQQQFVADASHELKTPLTVILSSADMLQSRPADDAGRGRWLENISVEGERMRALVENLLYLALEEEQREVDAAQLLDMSDLAENAVLTFEPAAFERTVTLESEIAPGCMVRAQREKLWQLLCILLDNGVKYTPQGGLVKLELEGGRLITLRVCNPGQAIPPEQRERLFDRFYRADASRSQSKGYGLGLSIAKEIVTALHGKIWVDCADGQVIFCVQLPAQR